MKIYKKCQGANGHYYIYIFGIRIWSYTPIHLHIVNGIGNCIKTQSSKKILINIHGNNNTIIIQDSRWDNNLFIEIGNPETSVDNCHISIGHNCSMGSVHFRIMEDNTQIHIGNDCMFSRDVELFPSDMHTILDIKGNILNTGKYIYIGNHVWVGLGVTILKNTKIADNCVVGIRSVVSGNFLESNCILAGCPATIRRKQISWDRMCIKDFTKGN